MLNVNGAGPFKKDSTVPTFVSVTTGAVKVISLPGTVQTLPLDGAKVAVMVPDMEPPKDYGNAGSVQKMTDDAVKTRMSRMPQTKPNPKRWQSPNERRA